MKFARAVPIVLALAFPLLAFAQAEPVNLCDLLSLADVNAIAENSAVRVVPLRSGNPSQCGYQDAKKRSVVVTTMRTVQYAAENELQVERENLEKIYRGKVKYLQSIGDNAFWMPVNKQLFFRKGKTLVSVKFDRTANQNEVDSAQAARVIEARLK
jgi:hypothetical protein